MEEVSRAFWKVDPIVRTMGGYLDVKGLTPVETTLVHWTIHVFEINIGLLDARDPDLDIKGIDLVISASDAPNAAARQSGDRRAVIISLGLLRILWRFLTAAAHHPDVLSRAHPLKDPDKSWKEVLDGPLIAFDDWSMEEERAEYFVDILMQMFDYVISHELAHLLRRHIDLLFPGATPGFVDEAATYLDKVPGRSPDILPETLQDIEFDADANGLNQMLLSMDEKHPFRTGWTAEDGLEYGFQLAFAHILVMRALDTREGPVDRPGTEHPSPLFRAMNFTNLVFRSLHDLVPCDFEESVRVHDTAWFEASEISKDIGFGDGRWFGEGPSDADHEKFLVSEARYFEATRRIDRILDGADNG